MMPSSREQRNQLTVLTRELRQWMQQSGANRALVLRRTVATVCLVLPETPRTLAQSVASNFSPGSSLCERAAANWGGVALQASVWAAQLVQEVRDLHAGGIAHACISPATVLVAEGGRLSLGDFLGKVVLHSVQAHGRRAFEIPGMAGSAAPGSFEAWASWYPAEVQLAASAEGSWQSLDYGQIDSWQLGVVLFYLLTGEHLFGAKGRPEEVCDNIRRGSPVNLPLLAGRLPLFAELVYDLTARSPAQRARVLELNGYPALWDPATSAREAWQKGHGSQRGAHGDGAVWSVARRAGELPLALLPLAPADALRHLPHLAPWGSATAPQAQASGCWLRQAGHAGAASPPGLDAPRGLRPVLLGRERMGPSPPGEPLLCAVPEKEKCRPGSPQPMYVGAGRSPQSSEAPPLAAPQDARHGAPSSAWERLAVGQSSDASGTHTSGSSRGSRCSSGSDTEWQSAASEQAAASESLPDSDETEARQQEPARQKQEPSDFSLFSSPFVCSLRSLAA